MDTKSSKTHALYGLVRCSNVRSIACRLSMSTRLARALVKTNSASPLSWVGLRPIFGGVLRLVLYAGLRSEVSESLEFCVRWVRAKVKSDDFSV